MNSQTRDRMYFGIMKAPLILEKRVLWVRATLQNICGDSGPTSDFLVTPSADGTPCHLAWGAVTIFKRKDL